MKKLKMALAFGTVLALLVGIMYLTWTMPFANWLKTIINLVLLVNVLVIIKMGMSILLDKEENEEEGK